MRLEDLKLKNIKPYKMELHELRCIQDRDYEGSILRVPGGWIYTRQAVGWSAFASVFVPFNDEFKDQE